MPDTISSWHFVFAVALAAVAGGLVAWRFAGVARRFWVFGCVIAMPVLLTVVLIEAPVPLAFVGWSIILVAGLTCLTVIDAQTRTIPDLVIVPMIVLGLVHATTRDGLFISFAVATLGVIAVGIVVGVVMKDRSGWIGGGDVLLFAGALAWLGPAVAPDILLLTGVGLGVMFSIRYISRLTRRKNNNSPDDFMPLAPTLGLAQLAVWLGGPLF